MGPRAPWSTPTDHVTDAVAADLAQGLTSEEAAERLERDGPNEIAAAPPTPWWIRLGRQFTDPLVVLLLIAIAISFVAWWSEGADGTPLEVVVIAAIVILNAGIGYWQEAKAIEAVAALRRLSATHATVLRDGQVMHIPTADLVVGDVVALAEGDAVGADCRLTSAASLHIAEASLTGESTPVVKDTATVDTDAPLADRTNMAFSGTAVVRGRGEALVVATGMDTEIGRIATLIGEQEEGETPLQRQVSWLGRQLGITVVVLSAIVVGAVVITAESRTFDSIVDAALVGVSLAVAAVPEGLPAILSVVLALGVQRMARERAIVKRLSSVETLGSASVICTDKTGTLTRNEMTIVRVATGGGHVDVTGVGYEPVGHAAVDGSPVEPGVLLDDVVALLTAGSLANDASLQEESPGRWTVHGDPTEAAFLVAEEKIGDGHRRAGYERVIEIPFTSERRRMSTVHRGIADDGTIEYVLSAKGAPDVILERCTHERRNGHTLPLDAGRRNELEQEAELLAADALRTIAVGHRCLDEPPRLDAPLDDDEERDLVHLGIVGILDPPRPEVAHSIAEAHNAGIRIIMITGDHPTTAARIGGSLGIVADDGSERGVTGRELGECDDDALQETIRERAVFARVEPEHKLKIVEALQADGEIVAMTGDGVNDAPALRRADIGVAMGITGTEVSKEASDMILADDNFATILSAVREGREIFADIRKVLRYLLASNGGEVLVMFVGVLAAGLLGLRAAGAEQAVPLLATQILWINLLTDGALALALGVDPAVDDAMTRPPRRVGDRIIDRDMLNRIFLLAVVSAISALAALDLGLDGGLIGGSGDIDTARTMAFSTLVLGQVCDAFNSRSPWSSAFVRPFDNRLLWASAVVTILLQVAVVHLPFMQTAFDTAPLGFGEWAIVIALASTVLWADEIRKLVVRRQSRRTSPTISSATTSGALPSVST
ncbi:MAG: cation-translocating P-type ATPase [Ilumatobacter sp.]|uniref:cation-translocating P-type ATPase n=1 Tax=Ilumatobacter sp. TaxID=1967498 RepID=UPI00261AD2F1|nr:cation-translocating P-type ATPase [Ilumatobacter sp.]MDJ0767336.1 cation-translocating P-type ATPase [Ilumatobacter sp.]